MPGSDLRRRLEGHFRRFELREIEADRPLHQRRYEEVQQPPQHEPGRVPDTAASLQAPAEKRAEAPRRCRVPRFRRGVRIDRPGREGHRRRNFRGTI